MMDFLIKAVIFLLIFTTIILVHEGGHFIVAKKNNIAVKEFSIGLGPRIFGITYHGTIYSVHLLPFGGACIFEGMFEEEEASENSFIRANVFRRFATVAAGPFCNFLLAFVLGLFLVGSIGYDPPQIAGVIDDFPAQQAGLMPGDIIKSLDGHSIVVYRDISSYALFYQGKSTTVVYERDGMEYTTVISPQYDESSGRYLFGITGGGERVKGNPLEVIRYSLHEVYYWIDLTYKSLGMIFQGRVTTDDLAGPVGMAQVVGNTYDEAKEDGAYYVWLNMLNLTILLSANLGVMNLLPIPALDGGRLVFIIIEMIRRKKIDPEKEAMVHFAGIMVLLALMIFIMFNDIGKFFR